MKSALGKEYHVLIDGLVADREMTDTKAFNTAIDVSTGFH